MVEASFNFRVSLPLTLPGEGSSTQSCMTHYSVISSCGQLVVGSQTCRRIVFLHGWWQDLSCWLPTAKKLVLQSVDGQSTETHTQCLLIDLPGHGNSSLPEDSAALDSTNMVECVVRPIIKAVEWAQYSDLVFAGCSLGGALAVEYVYYYRGNVARLVLVASAGLVEEQGLAAALLAVPQRLSPWILKFIQSPIFRAFKGGLFWRFLSVLAISRDTPQYGLRKIAEADVLDALQGLTHIGVVWSKGDLYHTRGRRFMGPSTSFPMVGDGPSCATSSRGDLMVSEWRSQWRTHELLCHSIPSIQLETYAFLWGTQDVLARKKIPQRRPLCTARARF